jgi:Uma2 family endonuclease
LILVEVLSDSSEEYDTGLKLEHYQTIASLRDYILVSHRERRIGVHHRIDAGPWSATVATAGGSVRVESIGADLLVDTIYRGSSIV